jgi:hypothetical protein
MTPAPRSPLRRATPLLLFACCFALYLAGSARLAATPVALRDNVFFRSDTRRVWNDLTGPRFADHRRTSTHPIFVLLHHPFGRGLTHALAAAGMEREPARRLAGALLTGAAGGLAVVFAFFWLMALGVHWMRAALFAGLAGGSAAHWLFASIPETWIFSALSLAALALVATRRGVPEWRFQLAAVYAIGVLTTNVVPVGVFALLRHVQAAGVGAPFRVLLRAAGSGAAALLAVIVLAFVQQAIYPTTTLFFLRDTIGKEKRWIQWDHLLEHPGTTAKILVRHLAIDAVVAPQAETQLHDDLPMASIEHAGAAHYRSRLPVLLLWAAVLAVAARGALRPGYWTPPVLAAFAILAYNFAFHSFFGNDRFLYACDWTLFTVGVVALAFDRAAPDGAPRARWATALAALCLAAVVLSSWRFLGEAVAAVGDGPKLTRN